MINMKRLQSNFTTIEQSERLLKLGLPADSVDCCLNGSTVIVLNGKTFQESYAEDLHFARLHLMEYPKYIPCWSVGRLIEILKICVTDEEEMVEIMENLIYWTLLDLTDFLLQTYQEYKEVIDFSKLED